WQSARARGRTEFAILPYAPRAWGPGGDDRRWAGGAERAGRAGRADACRLGDPRVTTPEAFGDRALAASPDQPARGWPRSRSGAVPPGDAGGLAQPRVGGAGLELRSEDAGGPLLAQPAGPAHRGGGLDSVRHRERGPRPRPDRVLVATGAGGGKPPREVPAALPAAVAGAADSGGRRSGPEAARAFRPLAVIDEDVALDLGRREWSAAEAATRRLPLKRQIDARLRAGAEPRVDSRTPSDLTLEGKAA